jgi:hypothetical protein
LLKSIFLSFFHLSQSHCFDLGLPPLIALTVILSPLPLLLLGPKRLRSLPMSMPICSNL